MAQIQLGTEQFSDLRVIRDCDARRLQSAVDKLARITPTPLKVADVLSVVKAEVEDDQVTAESITRVCLSLNGVMRHSGIDAATVVASIRAALERDSEWSTAELQTWATKESLFLELLTSRAFRIVTKAIDLAYEYANLYRKARILTDIRPLFTSSADAIEGAVVSYTLRLRFDSADGGHELSIAMDEGDVRDLSLQCERAMKKAETARDLMAGKAGVPTIVTGERHDA